MTDGKLIWRYWSKKALGGPRRSEYVILVFRDAPCGLQSDRDHNSLSLQAQNVDAVRS